MSYIAVHTESEAAISERKVVRLIAIIAISSVVLGFLMQVLILLVKMGFGEHVPQGHFLVQLAQGITWSAFVCTGIGLGATLSQAKPITIGMLGFVSAPLAIAASKFTQKLMAGLLNAAAEPAALSLFTLSTLRAVEYGVLGWLLGKLARSSELRVSRFMAVGAGTGVTFGGTISVLAHEVALANGRDPAFPQIVAGAMNEILFPIGCAAVIYLGQLVARYANRAT
jgi:hypothetical protein